MADFTTTITDQAVMGNSVVEKWKEGVIIAAQEELVMPQFVSQRSTGQASPHTFIVYANLTAVSSSLTDSVDPTSTAMSDTEVNITPVEYGNVVTTTALANLTSGSRVNNGAVKLVGSNMGQSIDKLAILTLEAGTSETIVTQSAESSLAAGNVVSDAYGEKMYNLLRRNNIPKLNGNYVAIMHPDVISDLRDDTGAGSWTDLNKYVGNAEIYKNEIGMWKGFKVIENSNISINADAGASAVDTYHSLFLGYNALGYAENLAPGMRLTGPYDKLGRFLNFGWLGVFAYGIIDQNAIQVLTSASGYGANT